MVASGAALDLASGDAASNAAETPRPAPGLCRLLDGLIAIWVTSLVVAPLDDNSFMTHLATGRIILEQGAVPTADPYSFTAAGEPWVVQSWLPSYVLAVGERLAGDVGIRLVVALTQIATVVGAWLIVRRLPSLLARIALFAPLVLLGTHAWTERPHLVGLIGIVVCLAIADRRCHPGWALPLFLVWTASHGSFPLGVCVLGASMVGRRLDGSDWRPDARALAFGTAGVCGAALGPVGWSLVEFPFRLLGASDARSHIVEWEPLSLFSALGALHVALVMIALVGLGRAFSWRVALVAVPFMVLPLSAVRHLSPAAVILVWAGASGLLGFTDSFSGTDSGLAARDALLERVGRLLLSAAVALGLVGLAVLPAWRLDEYPVGAVDRLEADGLVGEGRHRILSTDLVGNYLAARYGPVGDVFIDDRVDMYPESVIGDFVSVLHGDEVGVDFAHRWELDAALWPSADDRASDPPSGRGENRDAERTGADVLASWGWTVEWTEDGWSLWCPGVGCPSSQSR